MVFKNPFRPGAGHMPPYLAGREFETAEFRRLLVQDAILENLVLTGLRGVGKTVLLERFKPIAIQERWLWVGTDLSAITSKTEGDLATRIITDLSVVTAALTLSAGTRPGVGFNATDEGLVQPVNYPFLIRMFDEAPGLMSDKLKHLLEWVWSLVQQTDRRGIVFAYDEAQNLTDQAHKEQYPLSILLEVFQSIQRKGIPFMLALVGLPTLFPKLVEVRTYAERMFRVVALEQLDQKDRRLAIVTPVENADCPVSFDEQSVELIADLSGGYPYFIQFICREVFDAWIQRLSLGQAAAIPQEEILRKLDSDFFAGRWAKATDRQKELLHVIAHLANADTEFSVLEIVERSPMILEKGFGSSHVNQMLVSLTNAGLIYKNRYGRYSFAVPLMDGFIKRQRIPELALRHA